jgi:hypothetical protein
MKAQNMSNNARAVPIVVEGQGRFGVLQQCLQADRSRSR